MYAMLLLRVGRCTCCVLTGVRDGREEHVRDAAAADRRHRVSAAAHRRHERKQLAIHEYPHLHLHARQDHAQVGHAHTFICMPVKTTPR